MIRLVIVDDEFIVIEGIKAIIAREKLSVQVVGSANDGCTALDVILQQKPDLVITDIRMPGIDGFMLIEECQKVFCKMSFIIISGYSDFIYAKKALNLGVVDYIEKPITIDKFKKALLSIEHHSERERPVVSFFDELINAATVYDPEMISCVFHRIMKANSHIDSDCTQYKKTIFTALAVLSEVMNERLPSGMMIHIPYSELNKCTTEKEINTFAENALSIITTNIQGNILRIDNMPIRKSIQFIAEHYQQNIGLNDIAEYVHLNSSYVSILFKKEVGVSFIHYLSDYRIKKAKELLQKGKKTSEVSGMVGFADYRYFCASFKKTTGLTPTQFKRFIAKRGKNN
jgi:two-component system response regulator YesN